MKSITMSHGALKAALFLAYARNLDMLGGVIQGVITSHEFQLHIKKWTEDDGGKYNTILIHGFPKDAREMNSIEPDDIMEYIHQQYHEAWTRCSSVKTVAPSVNRKLSTIEEIVNILRDNPNDFIPKDDVIRLLSLNEKGFQS